jgi:hypothetical protein
MIKKEISDNINFFNKNNYIYGNHGMGELIPLDNIKIDFLSRFKTQNKKFIDVGGGSGRFIEKIHKIHPNFELTLIDPSISLLNQNQNQEIVKRLGFLPDNLPKEKYDIININRVIHHVIGKSIKESRILAFKSINNLNYILNKDGFIVFHEVFYESFLYKNLTSSIIFYLLKIQNFLKIQLPIKEFLLGLNVYFYDRKILFKLLKSSNFEIIYSKELHWKKRFKFNIALLKNIGDILIIGKKKNNTSNR